MKHLSVAVPLCFFGFKHKRAQQLVILPHRDLKTLFSKDLTKTCSKMNHNITNFEWKQKEKEKSLKMDEGITLMWNYYCSIKNVKIKANRSLQVTSYEYKIVIYCKIFLLLCVCTFQSELVVAFF